MADIIMFLKCLHVSHQQQQAAKASSTPARRLKSNKKQK
jgi:hypothetical protein